MMAGWRDYLCRRRHQVLDKLGLNRGWFRELSAYYRHMTIQEFWVRYTLGRQNSISELMGNCCLPSGDST